MNKIRHGDKAVKKTSFPTVSVITGSAVLALVLYYSATDSEDAKAKLADAKHSHRAGVSQPPTGTAFNLATVSPFGGCSQEAGCNTQEPAAELDESTPLRELVESHIAAIRAGNPSAVFEVSTALAQCSQLDLSWQRLGAVSANAPSSTPGACSLAEARGYMNDVDKALETQLRNAPNTPENLVLRTRWLMAKAEMEDARNDKDYLVVEKTAESSTIYFDRSSPPKRSSTLWAAASTLAESQRALSPAHAAIADMFVEPSLTQPDTAGS